MNSRFRNVCKAHDHIVKCRTKEGKRIFVPRWGNVRAIRYKMRKARYGCTVRD